MNYLSSKHPTENDATLAKRASKKLQAAIPARFKSKTLRAEISGASITLRIPTSALDIFAQILEEIGKGKAVKLASFEPELTTQEAADLLGVSRPTLIKLLNAGEIYYTYSGNRRKIHHADLVKYINDRD